MKHLLLAFLIRPPFTFVFAIGYGRGGRTGLVNGLAHRRVDKKERTHDRQSLQSQGSLDQGNPERTFRKLEWDLAEMRHAAALARTKSLTKLTDEERKALVLM